MNVPIQCTKCRTTLPLAFYNTPVPLDCPSCAASLQTHVFPAFLKRAEAIIAEQVHEDADACCFYHSTKKAALACDSCGRFICTLCEVELQGSHLCPQCIETGQLKGKLSSLEKHRTRYDSVALRLAVLPMLIFYLTVFTAPAVVYLFFRYRKMPGSLVRTGKWRWYVALTVALLQIGAWCIGIFFLVNHHPGHGR